MLCAFDQFQPKAAQTENVCKTHRNNNNYKYIYKCKKTKKKSVRLRDSLSRGKYAAGTAITTWKRILFT